MKSRKLGEVVHCKKCNKEIYRKRHLIKQNKYNYCSIKCKTISIIKKCGVCLSEFIVTDCRINAKYCSDKCRFIGQKDKMPNNFKGTDDYYFKIKTFERDKYTCQKCGLSEIDIMQLDHIKPKSIYPESRYDINNLQTLCPNCHARKTIEDKKIIREFKKSSLVFLEEEGEIEISPIQ